MSTLAKPIPWDEYLYNPGGALVMTCPRCRRDHYRDAVQVLRYGAEEYCVFCGDVRLVPVKAEEV